MILQEYIGTIKNTKKYNCVCDETIARIVESEMNK